MKTFFKSVICALRGVRKAASGRSFIIQMFCAILVVILMIVFRTSYIESAILIICIGLVLGGEVMNTALERLSDFVSPSHHKKIEAIKDMMAAGVLIFSLAALIVGILILGSHVFPWW